MTYDEVSKIDNGSYFNSEFADEKIPTLSVLLGIRSCVHFSFLHSFVWN